MPYTDKTKININLVVEGDNDTLEIVIKDISNDYYVLEKSIELLDNDIHIFNIKNDDYIENTSISINLKCTSDDLKLLACEFNM